MTVAKSEKNVFSCCKDSHFERAKPVNAEEGRDLGCGIKHFVPEREAEKSSLNWAMFSLDVRHIYLRGKQ